MSQEANLARLSEVVAQGWDEQLASIDSRTASVRDDEYMVVRVVDGVPRGLPEAAGDELRQIVDAVAALDSGKPGLTVQYSGPLPSRQLEPVYHHCSFSQDDLIIGGSAQRVEFEKLIANAHQRVIIHSTFIKASDVEALFETIRTACRRGVRFSVFWGAEYDEETESRNAAEAVKIMEMVSKDVDAA
ncbi:MAG: phosphatidylserine synthase, partial [Mesorhizobium sp.]